MCFLYQTLRIATTTALFCFLACSVEGRMQPGSQTGTNAADCLVNPTDQCPSGLTAVQDPQKCPNFPQLHCQVPGPLGENQCLPNKNAQCQQGLQATHSPVACPLYPWLQCQQPLFYDAGQCLANLLGRCNDGLAPIIDPTTCIHPPYIACKQSKIYAEGQCLGSLIDQCSQGLVRVTSPSCPNTLLCTLAATFCTQCTGTHQQFVQNCQGGSQMACDCLQCN